MKRTSVVILGFAAACVLIAVPAYSIWSTVDACTAKARMLLATTADPLERQPPQRVVEMIRHQTPDERLPDVLASIFLDRLGCQGERGWSGTDWLVDKPAFTWWLRHEFSRRELIGLYASTADMGRGTLGLNRGARMLYGRDVSELDDEAVSCLLSKAVGAGHRPCGAEGVPGVPGFDDVVLPPPNSDVTAPKGL